MSDISLNDAKSAMKEIVDDYHLVKQLIKQGEPDLAHSFLYDDKGIIDPETGEERHFDRGFEIEVFRQVILNLGGGGPALRAVLSIDKEGDVRDCQLQHRGYDESWEIYKPKNAIEEDALEWYLKDALDLQDLYLDDET